MILRRKAKCKSGSPAANSMSRLRISVSSSLARFSSSALRFLFGMADAVRRDALSAYHESNVAILRTAPICFAQPLADIVQAAHKNIDRRCNPKQRNRRRAPMQPALRRSVENAPTDNGNILTTESGAVGVDSTQHYNHAGGNLD